MAKCDVGIDYSAAFLAIRFKDVLTLVAGLNPLLLVLVLADFTGFMLRRLRLLRII